MKTKSAPSASAVRMSVPRRNPLSIITAISPASATMSGSTCKGLAALSSWRPPWLDTTMPSTP